MFDYGADAELFPGRSGLKYLKKNGYRRFSRADEAIQFAIEELRPELLSGAYLEVEEERFDASQIRQLYDDARFPLPRKADPRL
jgi:hypothetical protein